MECECPFVTPSDFLPVENICGWKKRQVGTEAVQKDEQFLVEAVGDKMAPCTPTG